MRVIAVISDIHANLPALEAVLEEVDALGIENILCCGDVVGYGPHSHECVEILRKREIPTVVGNHDFYTMEIIDKASNLRIDRNFREGIVGAGLIHASENLEADDIEWLRGLPGLLDLPEVVFGHAALHDMGDWPYLNNEEDILATLGEMEKKNYSLGFFGHSHDQLWFKASADGYPEVHCESSAGLSGTAPVAVVVGSVGQPRTGDPRAAWTLWQPEERSIEFKRTKYPVEKTIEAIRKAGLPESAGERLIHGR